jgi:uncharacterized membrane protein
MRKLTMAQPAPSPDRLRVFSDGVFAIIMTILVLELRPPESPTFAAFLSLWPTALSYAVSYLFLAIVWVNHHHVARYAEAATPRLIWGNFAHLFTVSLIPFPGSRPLTWRPFRWGSGSQWGAWDSSAAA